MIASFLAEFVVFPNHFSSLVLIRTKITIPEIQKSFITGVRKPEANQAFKTLVINNCNYARWVVTFRSMRPYIGQTRFEGQEKNWLCNFAQSSTHCFDTPTPEWSELALSLVFKGKNSSWLSNITFKKTLRQVSKVCIEIDLNAWISSKTMLGQWTCLCGRLGL